MDKTKKVKRIVVNITGGFGNQLFEYAFGYALSQELAADLYIDTSVQDYGASPKLELANFDIKYTKRVSYAYYTDIINRALFNKIRKRNAIGWSTRVYNEKQPTVYDRKTQEIKENTLFKGYWQSEKYFRKYRKELLDMFQVKEIRSQSVKDVIGVLSKQNSVALHVRRGDYVSIGCQLEMDFYDKAIFFMREKLGDDLKFYIFSDDTLFCRQYFGKFSEDINIVYPEYQSNNTTLDDLWIMSHCKHMIMANSTYSWWGAWLNKNENKIVVCPELGIWTGDFYPEEWVKIKM